MACSHGHGYERLAYTKPSFPETRSEVHTTTIQKQYARKLRGRFSAINAEARRGIVSRDIFNLKQSGEQLASDFDPRDLTPEEFPERPDRRTKAFMAWLREQYQTGVLSVITTGSNVYIQRAYEQGKQYADRKLHANGITVPDQLRIPVRAKTLDLLYSRNFSLLEGITEDHANRINRALTDGFLAGDNPRTIAGEITSATDIARNRSTALARYEVMNAHNSSTLDRFEQFDIAEVDVLTYTPCEECARIAANAPYTVSEARGQIPAHPNCQCSFTIAN